MKRLTPHEEKKTRRPGNGGEPPGQGKVLERELLLSFQYMFLLQGTTQSPTGWDLSHNITQRKGNANDDDEKNEDKFDGDDAGEDHP